MGLTTIIARIAAIRRAKTITICLSLAALLAGGALIVVAAGIETNQQQKSVIEKAELNMPADEATPRNDSRAQKAPHADAPPLLQTEPSEDQRADRAGAGSVQTVTVPVNPAEHVKFECRLKPGPDQLTVEYSFTNRHPQLDFYLFDEFPVMDPQTRQWSIDPAGAYVCVRSSPTPGPNGAKANEAFILKGIPPLPPNRSLVVRFIPLATKVAPGQTVERSFTIKLPLREQYGYHGPLPDNDYEKVKINSICFGLHWISSDAEGFEAVPDPGLPDEIKVSAKRLLQQVRLLESRKAVDGSVLRRKDAFARMEVQPPVPPRQTPSTASGAATTPSR